jgi:hypothetical protein
MYKKTTILAILSLLSFSCKKEIQPLTTNLSPVENTIKSRISVPNGYTRDIPVDPWQNYLQNLELLPGNPQILDYTGNPVADQDSHIAIINLDVGKKDLQQCADAIIRIRAEYLFKNKKYSDIKFHFTSGDLYKWTDHANGIRPEVKGNQVQFIKKKKKDDSYANFKNYLNYVFMYAGTISLNRYQKKVSRNSPLQIGDIIIKAGSPGHAVLIVDRAKKGEKYVYLLAEGYTPAQSIHILDSKKSKIHPWFKISNSGSVSSSRYYFSNPDIVRFQ